MMTVYAVMMMTDEEYGMTEVVRIYANRADAETYVAERQETMSVWFTDEPVEILTIEEFEVH